MHAKKKEVSPFASGRYYEQSVLNALLSAGFVQRRVVSCLLPVGWSLRLMRPQARRTIRRKVRPKVHRKVGRKMRRKIFPKMLSKVLSVSRPNKALHGVREVWDPCLRRSSFAPRKNLVFAGWI